MNSTEKPVNSDAVEFNLTVTCAQYKGWSKDSFQAYFEIMDLIGVLLPIREERPIPKADAVYRL